jgi:beta-1,2-mannosidase
MLKRISTIWLPILFIINQAFAQKAVLSKDNLYHSRPPVNVSEKTEAEGVPSWGLGPFIRSSANPILKPNAGSFFFCPILKKDVAWESKDIVGAAAAVKDGNIYWLYRAEPVNFTNSRVGLAISSDGVHFGQLSKPVIYPDNDQFKKYEWPGGTEDGRLVQREDGTYIYLYCAFDGKYGRQCVATSKDLVHWTKHGPVFADSYLKKFLSGKNGSIWTFSKGGSVVSRYLADGRVVAARINHKYWMYCIFGNVAYSDDCIKWAPLLDKSGAPITALPVRKGKFDGEMTEPGPPPVLTKKGILVLYHGGENNSKNGDLRLPDRAYSGGQALFALDNPTKLLSRSESFFLTPRFPYELNSSAGAPVCFMEGLIHLKKKWLLYYEAGDHVGCLAVCNKGDL